MCLNRRASHRPPRVWNNRKTRCHVRRLGSLGSTQHRARAAVVGKSTTALDGGCGIADAIGIGFAVGISCGPRCEPIPTSSMNLLRSESLDCPPTATVTLGRAHSQPRKGASAFKPSFTGRRSSNSERGVKEPLKTTPRAPSGTPPLETVPSQIPSEMPSWPSEVGPKNSAPRRGSRTPPQWLEHHVGSRLGAVIEAGPAPQGKPSEGAGITDFQGPHFPCTRRLRPKILDKNTAKPSGPNVLTGETVSHKPMGEDQDGGSTRVR